MTIDHGNGMENGDLLASLLVKAKQRADVTLPQIFDLVRKSCEDEMMKDVFLS